MAFRHCELYRFRRSSRWECLRKDGFRISSSKDPSEISLTFLEFAVTASNREAGASWNLGEKSSKVRVGHHTTRITTSEMTACGLLAKVRISIGARRTLGLYKRNQLLD
jgi:hypothetical protein